MILLDANILLRATNRVDPQYRHCRSVIGKYRKTDALVMAPQSLYEFWTVATRSIAVNGLGFDVSLARQRIEVFAKFFHLMTEPPNLAREWLALVDKYQITGFRAHDARYVALMQMLGISRLMTYNVKHFQAFPISIIDPSTVLP